MYYNNSMYYLYTIIILYQIYIVITMRHSKYVSAQLTGSEKNAQSKRKSKLTYNYNPRFKVTFNLR